MGRGDGLVEGFVVVLVKVKILVSYTTYTTPTHES
jgi:hypothetical protein